MRTYDGYSATEWIAVNRKKGRQPMSLRQFEIELFHGMSAKEPGAKTNIQQVA
ncbi:hypothetical protein [Nocardia sp. NBC_01327]|uniref:hypothetical protein n=1 Tax=Nocardia sp. NBC_01327 TaxID=2903593 RepID=UPI002E111495|nr:hypothetical protein OG326_19045 [Nocardia sp. NBC_01327]